MGHALLDVTDVLDDPDFLDTTLVLVRRVVAQQQDGTARGAGGPIPFAGVVIPDGGQELIQTPEGNQVRGDITVYTRTALTAGDANYDADVIHWSRAAYRVIATKPWLYASGYTQAIAALTDLNPTPPGTTAPDAGYLT